MPVELSILNAPPVDVRLIGFKRPMTRRQAMYTKSLNCGCGCNDCGDKSLNSWLSDAISDAGNFHLEVLDGIQRQWTGVDLIKTSFTAPWIKDTADGLTYYSHIAGAIVITYWAPALMPILIGAGIMIGSAIKGYDTRYLDYIDKMRKAPTVNLTEDQDKQLFMICVWACVVLLLRDPSNAMTLQEAITYFKKLKSTPSYTVAKMFDEMITSTNAKLNLSNSSVGKIVYGFNVTYKDAVNTIYDMKQLIFCQDRYTYSYTPSEKQLYLYAYQLISGQRDIDSIWKEMEAYYYKYEKEEINWCNYNGKQSKVKQGNPYKNFTDYSTEATSGLNASEGIPSPTDGITSPTNGTSTGSNGSSNNNSGTTSTNNTNTTPASSFGNNPFANNTPTKGTSPTMASLGWPMTIGLALLAAGSVYSNKKKTKKRK
jgi:hypothetical protein